MRVRLAQASDLPGVTHCVEAANAIYVERMDKKPAPMLDDYAALIDRRVVHVAETAGGVVNGLIVMWAEPDHFYVDNIAVAPDAQGTGVGARLLIAADHVARASGRDEIRLYTNEAMTENLGYYPSRGFVETHRGTHAGYRRVYFSRTLGP